MRATVQETGTPERVRHALALGDIPEDAPSTETPGISVRRYMITDMLSYVLRRRWISQMQHDAGVLWREDWYLSNSGQRVVSKMEPPVSGSTEGWSAQRIAARTRFEKYSRPMGPPTFRATYAIAIWDEPPDGRIIQLRWGLDWLAEGYGL
jgi:hypothetical protein